MPTQAQLAEILPLETLIRLRQQGLTYRAISRRFNIRRDTLNRYARATLPRHLLRAQPYINERTRRIQAGTRPCTHCDFFPEPRNPIMSDGLCLWCHVEKAGLGLLWYHESGLAKRVLDQLGDKE